MNWADISILFIVALSVLIGVLRGATREVLGVLGWALAFWVAFTFSDNAAHWLSNRIPTAAVRKAVAFGGLFLLTLIVTAICTYFLTSLTKQSALASVDRTLGGGFGVLRGLFIVAALLMVAETTPARGDAWYQQSMLISHLSWTADALRSITPPSWLRALETPTSDTPPPNELKHRSS